ncbi:MAG: hypothetical protein GIW99_08180 [Candidatus Eremiobacteraeota bacterium]|nr:hypothetical protein [Candidatus Eremiobacteraeota bacterium]MBC5827640.1 hypothetical protein [Candidatus Eremiobacteraeota bacterium]
MRAGPLSLSVSIVLCAIAVIAQKQPYSAWTHTWEAAVVFAVAGLASLAWCGGGLRSRVPAHFFAALGCLGGAIAALALTYAAFVVGQPQRIQAVPGQTFRPGRLGSLELRFPDAPAQLLAAGRYPDTVTVQNGRTSAALTPGGIVRSGAYVFRGVTGPLALIYAATPRGMPVTVTQPDGAAFLSAYLTFPIQVDGRPEDSFALPALHRVVSVAYYQGLPERGIDIPFLIVGIAEEHGPGLSRSVAVSGKTIQKSGVRLRFLLAHYPSVFMTSAPPAASVLAALGFLAAGIIGFLSRVFSS